MTIAVVTGANRGIGLEVCRQLAALGTTVVLTARSLDVSDRSSIARFVFAVGAVDVLVNNAAMNYDTAFYARLWRRISSAPGS